MPTSGCLMMGWRHSGQGSSPVRACRPSTVKKRPLWCPRLPVVSSNAQPSRAANGMRSTWKRWARRRPSSQSAKSSVRSREPAVSAADRAIRSAAPVSSRALRPEREASRS